MIRRLLRLRHCRRARRVALLRELQEIDVWLAAIRETA